MDKKFTAQEQKDAILYKTDLSVPIRGKVELIHKPSGNVLDTKKTILAHVPWITERNSSILHGTEYIALNQSRLKPGVYTRVKNSGETEAHINVLPGSGMGGRVVFFPEKELFVYMVQNTQIRLYGLLKALGTSDATMEA